MDRNLKPKPGETWKSNQDDTQRYVLSVHTIEDTERATYHVNWRDPAWLGRGSVCVVDREWERWASEAEVVE